MFTNTPSDRVQLVGLGELLNPACCMICRSGNCEEGYVRLGVWYDYEGEQYLCRTCLAQCAELIGCMLPEEVAHLQQQAVLLAADNATLKTNLEDANARLAVFDAFIARAIASGDLPTGTSDDSVVDAESTVGSTVGVDEQVISSAGESESTSDESAKGSDSSGSSQSELRNDASATGKPAIPRL